MAKRAEGGGGSPKRHVIRAENVSAPGPAGADAEPSVSDASVLDLVDRHVGDRVRLRRVEAGLSQHEVAEALGIGYQQIHKYEHGLNRISASRLFELAQLLKVHVSYFFADMPEHMSCLISKCMAEEITGNAVLSREISDLMDAFDRIEDPKVRRKMLEFLKTLIQ